MVVSLPPCSERGVASTATFGKVVVAAAIAITIAVIAIIPDAFFIFISNGSVLDIYKKTMVAKIKIYLVKNLS